MSKMIESVSYLIFFFLSVAGIAFFAGFESAFLSMNKIKLRHRAERKIDGADFLERLYRNKNDFLGFTLTGMTFFLVLALVFFVCFVATTVLGTSLFYFVSFIFLAILFTAVFGELLPRTYARDKSDKVIFFFIKPIIFTYRFFYIPVVFLTSTVTRFFMWGLGSDNSGLGLQSSKEELKLLVRLGERSGIVEDDELKLIESIFLFKGKRVSEHICEREHIVSVSVDSSLKQTAKLIHETGFSRLPVFDKDLDDIIGVVHISSILDSCSNLDKKVREVMTPVLYLLPDSTLRQALTSFKVEHSHMAIVVSRKRKTIGLLTLEDILEEVVGEIDDEFDHK